MKVTIYINREVDWQNMTMDKVYQQDMPYNLHHFGQMVLLWDRTYKLPYFEFRHRLSQIARNNWKKFVHSITSNTIPETDFILLSDDDDWYRPDIGQKLQGSIVYWKPAAFKTAEWEQRRFDRPYFDMFHKRKFYSNNWAIDAKIYSRLNENERKQLEITITANKTVEPTHFINEHLNLANKTAASMTCMLATNSKKLWSHIKRSQNDFSIPPEFLWAKEEIDATIQLYRETL